MSFQSEVQSFRTNLFFSLDKIKEVDIPCPVNSASLHPDKKIFVCGGDDFKLYKYDYESGAEIESFKGHFGPVHCVRFSPDGELYASGSEDGTLRLWQTEVSSYLYYCSFFLFLLTLAVQTCKLNGCIG